jgi:predicted Zn finger-like uncharacterized protein
VLHLRSEGRLSVFTQCSKCDTVFKLTPEILRVAGGQVRCGNCGEVFNALARLAEDASAFTTGESPLELEARAESILESAFPAEADEDTPNNDEAALPGVEIARLEVLDWPEEDQSHCQSQRDNVDAPDSATSDDDRSLEFTLPPGELDRIFIESKRASPPPAPPPEAPPIPQPETPPVLEQEAAPEPHPEAAAVSQVPHPEATPVSHPEAQASPEPAAVQAPKHAQSGFADDLPPRNRVSGFEVPEDVRRDMLSGFEQHIRPARAARPKLPRQIAQRRRFIWWLSAAIVLLLLLLAQVVHQNRPWFVARAEGPLGAVVRALYGALGSPLPEPASLSAYQLRQWGVSGDPDAQGTLRLRASILNAAAGLQPYPLLRVTLADRFGKSIAKRDFEPGEYMGRPAPRLLGPGERADATLDILDPGKNAEGFEIDVCLRGIDKRISCANDVAVQAKP